MSVRVGPFAALLPVFDMPASLAFQPGPARVEVVSDVPDDSRCSWIMLMLHGSELKSIPRRERTPP